MADERQTSQEPPSLDELARRYLDLWQDQWMAVAADPDMADSITRMLTTLGQSALALSPFLTPGAAVPPWLRAFTAGSTADDHATTPAGPPAPGPASDGESQRLAELSERIALLEERLAALATVAPGTRGNAAGGGRRRPRG